MNEEALVRVASSRVTRRTIVTTGTKLAYAAPLVAASFKLTGSGVLAADGWVTLPVILCGEPGNDFCVVADTPGQNDGCKTVICHRTCSDTNPYNAIEIARDCGQSDGDALAAHILQHNPTEKCDREDVLATNVTYKDNGHFDTADCPGGGVGNPSIA
jgi:hypothetical protein